MDSRVALLRNEIAWQILSALIFLNALPMKYFIIVWVSENEGIINK